ncbi:J domain-containing protein [Halovenus halobia]|uniref:J domain-containing protein n=1 Tax=Halovenus halobia TaxID=3396622 RepID=UPI003F55FCA2
MGETFYTILEVSPDADDGTVRRAYRRAVKECHPDVSDDPAAGERFKRLTTARDVLLDADERKTYDRLGHANYVDQHVDTSVWAAVEDARTTNTSTQTTGPAWSTSTTHTDAGTTSTTNSSGQQRDAQQSTESQTTTSRRQRRWNGRQHSRADGGYDRPWQRAPDAYQRTQTTRRTASQTSVLEAVRSIGPWLFIHFVLLTSALATSGSLLSRVDANPMGTVATGLFSVLIVAVVLLLSFLHILTEVS